MHQSHSKLGFNGTWSMGVGGMVMVGRGIFATLGVVGVGIIGARARLSFATAGFIAQATGDSSVKLAAYCG